MSRSAGEAVRIKITKGMGTYAPPMAAHWSPHRGDTCHPFRQRPSRGCRLGIGRERSERHCP